MAAPGCAGPAPRPSPGAVRLPLDYLPLPAGRTAAYRIPASAPAVARRRPVAGLRCRAGREPAGFAIHLELYAHRLVVPIPAGIGLAPPLRRTGAYVIGGACRYPIRTSEPTGVFTVSRSGLTLGDLFSVWGQPLSAGRLAGFTGRVRAYVAGRPVAGDPRAVPLRRHGEIVLELGAFVPPHAAYLFPPGR